MCNEPLFCSFILVDSVVWEGTCSIALKLQKYTCPCHRTSDKTAALHLVSKPPLCHIVRCTHACCRLLLQTPPLSTWNNPVRQTLARGLINPPENRYTKVSLLASVGVYVMPAKNMATVCCLSRRPDKLHTLTLTHTRGTGMKDAAGSDFTMCKGLVPNEGEMILYRSLLANL